MSIGVIAKKRGMTQIFDEEGQVTPVTILELYPLTVSQSKTKENDGYTAVQVAYEPAKAKHVNKPEQGLFNKIGIELHRHLQEFRLTEEELAQYSVGQALEVESVFQAGDAVKVTGTSIGKGFQGTVKAWHFGRGPMSHGSKSHRLPGSIGAGTTPSRVRKGLKMAKNLGNETVTVKNLKVMNIVSVQDDKTDATVHLLLVSGAVPGKKGSVVTVLPFKRVGQK